MGLLDNQSTDRRANAAKGDTNALRMPSAKGLPGKTDQLSSYNVQHLLQEIQTRKDFKEQSYILTTNAIKTVTQKVINEIKLQEEYLLDKLWKKNRKELSQLQKYSKDLKKRLEDMTKLRENIKRKHSLPYNSNSSDHIDSVDIQRKLQIKMEKDIKVLAQEGKKMLKKMEATLVFENNESMYTLGHLEEVLDKQEHIYSELRPQTLRRQRSNTIVAIPDININTGKSTLRKARSTDDLFYGTHKNKMSMVFQMSNEDLCALSQQDENRYDLKSHIVYSITKPGKNLGQLLAPRDATFLPNGCLLITEHKNNRIQVFDTASGKAIKLLQSVALKPCGIAMTKDGYISVVDQNDNTLKILTRSGEMVCQFGTGYFRDLSFVAIDSHDSYMVIDNMGAWQQCVFAYNPMTGVKNRIGYNSDGTYVLNHPEYVTVDEQDNIVVSDSGNHCIWVFDKRRNLKLSFGQPGDKEGELCYPKGVCVTKRGHFIVSDCGNHRICQFDSQGVFVKTLFNKADGLDYPQVVQLQEAYLVIVQSTGIIVSKL